MNHPSTRERLPTDRTGITHKFKLGGHKIYLTVGLYPDGRPAEIFCHFDKSGSTVNGLLQAISLLTSVALQHGISLEYLKGKFEGVRFEPNGMTSNADIQEASSIVDYIFRWIDIELKKRKKIQAAEIAALVERGGS